MQRLLTPILFLAMLLALCLCGCRQQPRTSVSVDPDYYTAPMKTVVIIPAEKGHFSTAEYQLATFRISDQLRRTHPGVSVTDITVLKIDDNKKEESLFEIHNKIYNVYNDTAAPKYEFLSDLGTLLDVDGVLIWNVSESANEEKDAVSTRLSFGLYGTRQEYTKPLWSGECAVNQTEDERDATNVGEALCKGIDLVFATMPKVTNKQK